MSTTPYFRTLAGIGNLGVGTTSPTANLQVVGNVYASNALTATNVLATTMNTGTMNVTSIAVSGSTATTGYVLSSTSSGTGLAWVAQSGGLSGLGTNGILYATSATTAATVPTYVYSGGNVGIGTAGPTANLHVYGTSTSNIQMIVNNISTSGGTNHSAYIHSDQSYCGGTSGIGSFTYSAATLLVTSYPNNTANNSGYTVYFGTSAADLTSLSPQMVVKSATGYVGIGVASPTTALQVSGTVTATAFAGSGTSLTSIPMGQASGTLAIANGGTGASSTSQNYVFAGPTSGSGAPSFRGLASGDIPNNAANTSGSAGSLSTTYGTGQILYGQASGVPASTSTFVYSGGSVGIGTATPGAQLTLTSNVYAGGYIQSGSTAGGIQSQGAYMGWNITNGVGETDFINQQGLGSGGWRWYNYNNSAQLTSNAAALSAAGGLTLGTYSNAYTAPTGGLICPGNVGVGTTNPQNTLNVVGSANVYGQLTYSLQPFLSTVSLSVASSAAAGWYRIASINQLARAKFRFETYAGGIQESVCVTTTSAVAFNTGWPSVRIDDQTIFNAGNNALSGGQIRTLSSATNGNYYLELYLASIAAAYTLYVYVLEGDPRNGAPTLSNPIVAGSVPGSYNVGPVIPVNGFSVSTSTNFGQNAAFLITSGGNVGINTTSPGVPLEVNGAATFGNPWWIITGSGGNATYSAGQVWGSSAVNGTYYGSSVYTGGGASSSQWNGSTGIFTFPQKGMYSITVTMFINGALGGRWAVLRVGSSVSGSGDQYMDFDSVNLGSNYQRNFKLDRYFNANDTFYCQTEGGQITLYWALVHTVFFINKIG